MKVLRNNYLQEMGTVGTITKNYRIFVNSNDNGDVPHFHCRRPDDRRDTCIKLLCAEYFQHGKNTNTLSTAVCKELYDFLRSPSKDLPAITNWQYLVSLWNHDNRRNVPIDTPLPDYTKLNKEK